MNKTLLVIIAIVLVSVFVYAYNNNESEMMVSPAGQEATMVDEKIEEMNQTEKIKMNDEMEVNMKDEMMTESESKMEKNDVESETMMESESEMSLSGSYETYTESKLAKAENGKVVLFFRASWCPSCRTLDSDIKANKAMIPAGLTILDIDYDQATALKQKYGVTTQHTLVQVDAKGEMLNKWSGGATLASVVTNLK
jgi:thiol-disulfide isomerase/thioredoxin